MLVSGRVTGHPSHHIRWWPFAGSSERSKEFPSMRGNISLAVASRGIAAALQWILHLESFNKESCPKDNWKSQVFLFFFFRFIWGGSLHYVWDYISYAPYLRVPKMPKMVVSNLPAHLKTMAGKQQLVERVKRPLSEPQKKNSYFLLYWMVNGDACNGLL